MLQRTVQLVPLRRAHTAVQLVAFLYAVKRYLPWGRGRHIYLNFLHLLVRPIRCRAPSHVGDALAHGVGLPFHPLVIRAGESGASTRQRQRRGPDGRMGVLVPASAQQRRHPTLRGGGTVIYGVCGA